MHFCVLYINIWHNTLTFFLQSRCIYSWKNNLSQVSARKMSTFLCKHWKVSPKSCLKDNIFRLLSNFFIQRAKIIEKDFSKAKVLAVRNYLRMHFSGSDKNDISLSLCIQISVIFFCNQQKQSVWTVLLSSRLLVHYYFKADHLNNILFVWSNLKYVNIWWFLKLF